MRKVSFIWAKKVQKNYLSWSWREIEKFERNELVVSKLTERNWEILTSALKSHKNFYLNRLLLRKIYIVSAKIVQKNYLSRNWRGYKSWREIDLLFQDWHKEFDKFLLGHSQVSNIFTLIGFLSARYILFELKKCSGVIFHEI